LLYFAAGQDSHKASSPTPVAHNLLTPHVNPLKLSVYSNEFSSASFVLPAFWSRLLEAAQHYNTSSPWAAWWPYRMQTCNCVCGGRKDMIWVCGGVHVLFIYGVQMAECVQVNDCIK